MSASDPPSPPSAMPVGTPIAPHRAPSRPRWVLSALVAVVVAVVVIAALFATGTLRIGATNSSNPTFETFSQAESVASGGAGGVAGGPWFAAYGAGVATPTAVLEPTTNLSGLISLLNCTITWPGGEPANLVVPATPASAAIGAAAYWTFGFKNASNVLLVETVSDGVATPLIEASGAKCAGYVGYLAPFPPGVVDSPAIIGTANQNGGSAFLSAHPNATRAWGAIGGVQLGVFAVTSPEWYVEYTSCTLPTSAAEVGAVFNATLGGTSGVLLSNATGSTNCELTAPSGLGVTLAAGSSGTAARKAI
jgi:hypothetical protein